MKQNNHKRANKVHERAIISQEDEKCIQDGNHMPEPIADSKEAASILKQNRAF